MTATEARQYAERIYRDVIEPVSIMSGETAYLIKERIAHAYMDGAIAVLGSLNFSEPKTPLKSYEHPTDHAHIYGEHGEFSVNPEA